MILNRFSHVNLAWTGRICFCIAYSYGLDEMQMVWFVRASILGSIGSCIQRLNLYKYLRSNVKRLPFVSIPLHWIKKSTMVVFVDADDISNTCQWWSVTSLTLKTLVMLLCLNGRYEYMRIYISLFVVLLFRFVLNVCFAFPTTVFSYLQFAYLYLNWFATSW